MNRIGLLLLFVFIAATAFGSVATGTIEGHVTINGISLPGATVTVVSPRPEREPR